MNTFGDKYRTQSKIALMLNFQYRTAMAIWLIGLVLEPLVYLKVWTTVTRTQGGSMGGYAAADFIVVMLVNHATFLVPVAFAITVPAEALAGRLAPATALGALALMVTLLGASRWFWQVGVRHYSGDRHEDDL